MFNVKLLMLGSYMFMMLCGLLVFIFSCDYLLVSLLSLEYISLSLFVGLINMMLYGGFSLDFMIIFLIMMVCEGVIGLSLLVIMVRSSGLDYYGVLNMLRC
uniref:NADH-ubiquinone oxidoreductase chain 4L n=1 Tax=Eosembia sp. FS-2017 TaxID=2021303 RepID=A0A678QF41_9NEOP|nr:NADH dehydrogenase subunit 4L [Eosembia sp. FS-2017]